MTFRFQRQLGKGKVRNAAVGAVGAIGGMGIIEALEARAYLTTVTGVELGTPVNLSATADGIAPVFANLADFNNDNKADLFIANAANSVSVLIGNGDASFGTPVTIPVSGSPLPLATGYFTSDHTKLDIVAGTTGTPGSVSIILGNGDGTFAAANNIPALANNQAIAVGDFNNDTNLDVITVSNNATPTNNAEIIFGNGQGGTSVTNTPFSLSHGSISAVATGDFNGDGNLDFVVVNQAANSVTVYLGNGNGTFRAPVDYGVGSSPTSIAVGDFNNDHNMDIVTADSTGGAVSFLGGNGDGTFKGAVNTAVPGVPAGGGPLKVRTTNFTGSGNLDLLLLLDPGSNADADVMLGNGNGTFHLGTQVATHGGLRNAIAAGDLNGDGLTDAVVTNRTQISALLNVTNQDTTAPTAAVDATQAPASTLLSTYNFTVTYTDNKQVDAATLSDSNLVVTYPDGTSHAATLVSKNLGNGATVQATYQISFPSNLTAANDGTYRVSINANSVTDAARNPVAAGSIGNLTLNVTTTVDTTSPTAAVDATQVPGSTQASVYDFTVTYTDNIAVNAATLGNGNLTVTLPDTTTQAATLVSTGLASAGTVQATYQITFPANLTTANNGTYTVLMNANSVTDTSGNAVAAGNIGTFALAVSPSQPPPGTPAPTGDFTVGNPTGKIPVSVVTGSKQKSPITVTVTNGTAGPLTGPVTVTLYISSTTIHDGTAVQVAQMTHKVKKLKSGKGFKVTFGKRFIYPTAGTVFLVADAAFGGKLDSTDGASSAITVAQAFVDAKAISAIPAKSTLVANKKVTVNFTIQNIGNVPYAGPATVDVVAVPTAGGTSTTLATAVPIHLNIKNNGTKKIPVKFLPLTLPATGSYNLMLTIHLPGDTSSANDVVTTAVAVTV